MGRKKVKDEDYKPKPSKRKRKTSKRKSQPKKAGKKVKKTEIKTKRGKKKAGNLQVKRTRIPEAKRPRIIVIKKTKNPKLMAQEAIFNVVKVIAECKLKEETEKVNFFSWQSAESEGQSGENIVEPSKDIALKEISLSDAMLQQISYQCFERLRQIIKNGCSYLARSSRTIFTVDDFRKGSKFYQFEHMSA